MNELVSAIISHISSEVAAGSSKLKMPADAADRNFRITLRKSTGNRMKHISNEIVTKVFQSAFGRPSGWLQIFVLDAGQFQESVSNGLSALSGELRTLDGISDAQLDNLSGLGIRSGTVNMIRSLASSKQHVPTPTSASSSSNTLQSDQMTTTTIPKPTFSDFESFEQQLDSHLASFFLFADQVRVISSRSRLSSEQALFELRKTCSTAMENYVGFHKSSRGKHDRFSSTPTEDSDSEI